MDITNNLGLADVTWRGIKFSNLYYTCDLAIKEQWFEKARIQGPWKELIVFDKKSLDSISLVSPQHLEKIVCNIIRMNTNSGEKLEHYFQSIQKLKATRHSKSSRRRP